DGGGVDVKAGGVRSEIANRGRICFEPIPFVLGEIIVEAPRSTHRVPAVIDDGRRISVFAAQILEIRVFVFRPIKAPLTWTVTRVYGDGEDDRYRAARIRRKRHVRIKRPIEGRTARVDEVGLRGGVFAASTLAGVDDVLVEHRDRMLDGAEGAV